MTWKLLAAAALALLVPSAPAAGRDRLVWLECGGFQCASLKVPRDYGRPDGARMTVSIVRLPARDQARRIGALFVNPGGPGRSATAWVSNFGRARLGALNDRLDIVGVDPRGADPAFSGVDCQADQETEGLYAQPFPTPATLDEAALLARARAYVQRCRALNGAILPYLTTASTARDMDRVRAAMGEERLNYLGYSYGTFLGATYASLFPGRYRAMVLDGPVDAAAYANAPSDALRGQSDGFEQALGRFLDACAARQDVCGFGGADPRGALDALVASARVHPIPAGGNDPRPVDGDDVLWAVAQALYSKPGWLEIAGALRSAAAGDATLLRELSDRAYGRRLDGSYSPDLDRYFLITAADERYTSDLGSYLATGAEAADLFPHAYWNNGYPELDYGVLDLHPHDVFRGPFRASRTAPTVLEVATTFDPATPYAGALRLARELGNVRLLTMQGDGHTAFPRNSRCIDRAVRAYVERLALPARGTVCAQQVPFERPSAPVTPGPG